jgi:CRISPR/Cas system CMR subunit Cmr4 (Cas7 group RAMP superfamily)
MKTLWLSLTLLSDSAFGRGDGVVGVVDSEVQHDDHGLPFLSGKTLKGLLCAECAEILYALAQAKCANLLEWHDSARWLFGESGSEIERVANMHVGDARLPEDIRLAVMDEVRLKQVSKQQVLDTLTTIRRQSAIDEETGAPKKEALRATRVILRETLFEARLDFAQDPQPSALALLSACVKAFRRAGTERHRGRGRLRAELYEKSSFTYMEEAEAVTDGYFNAFREAVTL